MTVSGDIGAAQVLTEIRLWKQEADLSPSEGGGSERAESCSPAHHVIHCFSLAKLRNNHHKSSTNGQIGYKWAMVSIAILEFFHAILPAVPQPDLDGCEKWLPELVGAPIQQQDERFTEFLLVWYMSGWCFGT